MWFALYETCRLRLRLLVRFRWSTYTFGTNATILWEFSSPEVTEAFKRVNGGGGTRNKWLMAKTLKWTCIARLTVERNIQVHQSTPNEPKLFCKKWKSKRRKSCTLYAKFMWRGGVEPNLHAYGVARESLDQLFSHVTLIYQYSFRKGAKRSAKNPLKRVEKQGDES